VAFLNIGYFYRKNLPKSPITQPEFYTLSPDFLRKHHQKAASGWQRVLTKGLDLDPYRDERGFERIATDLGIPRPGLF